MDDQVNQSGGWQLVGSAAESYEQYFVPILFEPWADRLIEWADLHEGDRVLDVACGTGIVARRAAQHVGEEGDVVGVDINTAMLAVAEETAADIRPAIEWREADAADLPFPDTSFDVVFCQQALQYFAEQSAALAEMRRVLAPGGRLVLSVWRPLDYQPGYIVLADALEEQVGPDAGEMMRSPFPSWEVADIRVLAEDAGFGSRKVSIEVGSVRFPTVEEFVRREVVSSPLSEQLDDAAVWQAVVGEVAGELEDYIDDDGVVLPLESYILIASP